MNFEFMKPGLISFRLLNSTTTYRVFYILILRVCKQIFLSFPASYFPAQFLTNLYYDTCTAGKPDLGH